LDRSRITKIRKTGAEFALSLKASSKINNQRRNADARKNAMINLPQVNAERLKDLQREAENERLVRSQNQEKPNVLKNVLNVLKNLNSAEKSR
jgi:hypothetical protein